METQLSVRLPRDLAMKMGSRAKRLGLKRSDVVRLALIRYLQEGEELASAPYERVSHLIGTAATGVADLGLNHREYLIRKIKDRARH